MVECVAADRRVVRATDKDLRGSLQVVRLVELETVLIVLERIVTDLYLCQLQLRAEIASFGWFVIAHQTTEASLRVDGALDLGQIDHVATVVVILAEPGIAQEARRVVVELQKVELVSHAENRLWLVKERSSILIAQQFVVGVFLCLIAERIRRLVVPKEVFCDEQIRDLPCINRCAFLSDLVANELVTLHCDQVQPQAFPVLIHL